MAGRLIVGGVWLPFEAMALADRSAAVAAGAHEMARINSPCFASLCLMLAEQATSADLEPR
ncbi:hypothetical protein AQZ50_04110 [Novosphingobium sp. Fuku2-ISO-50]|nr:hypothetical protein AQZ50_04110 [Novosphingobium sp. Fuku2-ISO-50]